MIANPAIKHEWIQSDQLTAAEMVEEIQSRYETLDPGRRYMFIEWLQAHSSRVKDAVIVRDGLTAWLASMQHEDLQWEYRLIMDEIDWWRNLDEKTLTRIMLADLARNGER